MKKLLITSLIIAILACAVVYVKQYKSNNKEDKKEEYKEISKDLNTKLRSLIPSGCNGYRPEIYNDSKNDYTIFTQVCDYNHLVFTLEYKTETDGTNYFIYDYILIYNNEKDKWLDYYDHYLEDKIEEDDNAYPTDSSFKKYGRLYKYTFKKEKDNYVYKSTEPVK